jgi:hypothetical protein
MSLVCSGLPSEADFTKNVSDPCAPSLVNAMGTQRHGEHGGLGDSPVL